MPVTIFAERPRGTETVRGTVLFADLRGYTTLAEQLRPVSVVTLLEEFFGILAAAIEARGGTVFHSAGDSLMAGFGLSNFGDGPVRDAVDAGRQIVAAFAPASARWQQRLGVATGVGIGLNVGEVALAELGPSQFRRRTLIGDTVNVAARLCQRARAGEVLLSANVLESLEASAVDDLVALPDFTVRGRDMPVRIFCVPARERLQVERLAAGTPPSTPAPPG